jgi:hypothetical protein
MKTGRPVKRLDGCSAYCSERSRVITSISGCARDDWARPPLLLLVGFLDA